MRHVVTMVRGALHGIVGLTATLAVTAALAQPLESPEATPDPDNEIASEQELDFSLPPLTPLMMPEAAVDASKFTAGPTAGSGWDAKVGLDYRAPATPNAAFRPDRILPGAPQDQSQGVAWANVTAPGLGLGTPWSWDKTSFESRLDPAQEGKLGMLLSRSVPVGGDVAVTIENGYAMTQPLARGGLHVFETNQALRFSILPSETTLSVGGAISSTDDKWLPSLSAEQKLFGGPVSVTGSVSESATGEFSKSLKAGFKRTW